MFELFGITWGLYEIFITMGILSSALGILASLKKAIRDGSFKFKGLAENEIKKLKDEEMNFIERANTILRAIETKEEEHEEQIKKLADKVDMTYKQIKEIMND